MWVMLLLYSFNLVFRDRSFDVKSSMCLTLWFCSACLSAHCINCWQLIPSVYSCQPENHYCKTLLNKPRTVLRALLQLPDPQEGSYQSPWRNPDAHLVNYGASWATQERSKTRETKLTKFMFYEIQFHLLGKARNFIYF